MGNSYQQNQTILQNTVRSACMNKKNSLEYIQRHLLTLLLKYVEMSVHMWKHSTIFFLTAHGSSTAQLRHVIIVDVLIFDNTIYWSSWLKFLVSLPQCIYPVVADVVFVFLLTFHVLCTASRIELLPVVQLLRPTFWLSFLEAPAGCVTQNTNCASCSSKLLYHVSL